MRLLKVAFLTGVLTLMSGCGLLQEGTLDLCNEAWDVAKEFVSDFPDGDQAAAQDAIDECLAQFQADSQRWELEWEKLMQTIRDAVDVFDWLDVISVGTPEQDQRKEAAARLIQYLEGKKQN